MALDVRILIVLAIITLHVVSEPQSISGGIREIKGYLEFDDTGFKHSDGTALFRCLKIENGADESCEPYCTNEPLCLGYVTMAQYGMCLLYPKKPTDGSDYICPPGFTSRNPPGTYPETTTDLVPGGYLAGYQAYVKIFEPTTTTTTPEPTPEPTNPEPTEPPKTEKCWNLRPKRQCRRILMKGFCAKKFWARSCCRTCGGCGNIWSRKRCSKLTPFCRRSNKIRKKCKKSCKQC